MTKSLRQVHTMNVEQRQAAADPQIKRTDLSCESANRLLSSTPTINSTQFQLNLLMYGSCEAGLNKHREHHHLVLLRPKADIYFTVR